MKFFKKFFKEGRQKSGYKTLTLIKNKLFKFDLYLIYYPSGSKILPHYDRLYDYYKHGENIITPISNKYEHHRINLVLKKSRAGGIFYYMVSDCTMIPKNQRLIKFRPDEEFHGVTECVGSRIVLSLGYLKRRKEWIGISSE